MACLNEEEILECLYSLPKNDDDSEEECDEDAAEELTALKQRIVAVMKATCHLL